MRGRSLRAIVVALAAAGLLAGAATAQELNRPPKGFVALFNGRDLTNWQGVVTMRERATLSPEALKQLQEKRNEEMRAHWSVQNGILVYDGKGNSLQTVKDYGNFELYVDWKIEKGGDSGIYLRGNPQVQIWDNPIGSGGLFNNKKNPSTPLTVADNPVGQWNTFYIRMVGDRVTVRLNGKLVVDQVPLENYWEPGKPLPARGPIELQHHGNRLEFRNIFIRELPDDAAALEPPARMVTLEVNQAPFAQVIQLLAANGAVDIILKDPDGRLSVRQVGFISIKEKPIARAVELVCRAAGAEWTLDGGIFYIQPKR